MTMKAVFEVKRRKRSVTQGEAVVYLNGVEIADFADEYAPDGKYGDVFYEGKGRFLLFDQSNRTNGCLKWGSVKPDETFIMAVLLPDETTRKYYQGVREQRERKIKRILQGEEGETC